MTPEQLAAFILWATEQGWDEAAINAVISSGTAKPAPEPAPETPDMAAGADPAAAAAVMAARTSLASACASGNPAVIQAAQKAYAAAVAKTKKPAAPLSLKSLVASVAKQKAAVQPTAPAAVTRAAAPQAGAIPAEIQAQLDELKAAQDQMHIKELEREGLLAGIDDPMGLYAEAPGYFLKKVQANVTLAGSGAPAGAAGSPLRALKAVDGEGEGDADHRAVTAYREAQKKSNRILSYAQALTEWEAANPKPKKKAL